MAASDWIALGSAGIALLALIVAIVVAVRQHGLSSRMTDIEEARRAEEIDEKQTAVIALSRADYDHGGFYVVLTNEGAAVAEAVELSAWSEERPDESILREDTVRIPRLYTGDQQKVLVTLVIGQHPPFGYLLTWTDGRGPQAKRGHL